MTRRTLRVTLPLTYLFTTMAGFWTPASAFAGPSLREVIDMRVREAWTREKIQPVSRCDDATFLRRVTLDLTGTVPIYLETKKFLEDTDAQKRAKKIEQLLEDPRFATHQANVWDLAMFGRNPANGDATRKRDIFKKWLAGKFAKNEPYDRWVRALLKAEEQGSELYYVQYRNNPEEATVGITRLFMGTQLQCARCHDHPYDRWTQRDFFGVAGFFVRLVVLDAGSMGNNKIYKIGEKNTGDVLFAGAAKDLKPGQKGDPVKPKFLGGPVLEEPALPKDFKEVPPKDNTKSMPKPSFSRKDKFAEWVTQPDNPYFARAAVNRVWGQFMGRGLVHPVDDLAEKNTASHPELLDTLAKEFVAHRFDMKWLIREIVSSDTYQLDARGAVRDALPKWFERARVRPLSAEELMASLRVVVGYDTDAKSAETKLPNVGEEYFLRFFGEPTNGLGEFQGSLSEHLFMNNSGNVRQLIQRRKGNLADILATSKDSWADKVDRLYLTVLNRLPGDEEKRRFVAHLESDPKKSDLLIEEAIWVLINCSEFRFNH